MLRLGLALLAAFHLLFGVPAVVAPRWFFDHFPGAGQEWTAAYPPYNEHLMTDVGAAFTTLGVLLALAAVMMDRRVTNVVLIGLLVFSVLHLGYHTARHGTLHGGELIASLVSLAAGVLAPIALLWLNRRRT
jgi:hypothetical protein